MAAAANENEVNVDDEEIPSEHLFINSTTKDGLMAEP